MSEPLADSNGLAALAARAYADAHTLAYARLTPELVIAQASPNLAQVLEAEPDSLVGRALLEVAWEFVGAEAALAAVARGETAAFNLLRVNRERPDGSLQYLNFTVTPLRDAGSAPNLLLLVGEATAETQIEQQVMQDRNELRLTQAALARANAELERLNAFKSFLLTMVAHDLRSPLNAVQSYTELSLEESAAQAEPELTRYLQLVTTMAGRMDRLIDNLLDLDQLERGQLKLKPQPCQLPAVVEAVAAEFAALLRFRELSLEFDWPEDLPTVAADPLRLFQVFYNLLSNAVKYTPDGGAIRVTGRAEPGRAVVALTNPGRGLSEAQLANLFRLYYRTDEARQSKIAGTGLGLYIVRALVEAHGGTVTAASTRGSASQRGEEVTFTVTLPASNS
jgi:signal transduction histidine kinase